MCLHVFAKKNWRSQKLSHPPSYAQFISLVTQAMVKIDGFPGMAHGTYGILIGVEAFAHLDREIFALRGQGLGQGLGQETERLMLSTRVRDRMGPEGMGRDGKGWWWMMVDDAFKCLFHVFSWFFEMNLSDFVAGEAAEQRRRDLGSHSNGDGHCHAAVDQSSSGTGPHLGTTCGNRPSGPVPKKKVKHHPEVRCSSSHPNKMGPTSSKPSSKPS